MNPILHRIDLNLLRVFDALMQEGHLTRAAERLHMSQPAVSNALARLRAQLDEPLFVRTARGMTPTASAEAMHGPVRAALRLLQDGLSPAPSFDPGRAAQRFHLAMNDYAQCSLLPPLLERIRRLAPKLVLSVEPDAADALPTRLAAGTLDLAIDYLHFDAPDLRYEPLIEEPLVVIARRGHPAIGRDRQGRPAITHARYEAAAHVTIPPRAGRGSPLEIVLGSSKVRRRIALLVPGYMAIPGVVAQSDLIGTVPRRLAEQFAPGLPLVIVPMPFRMPPVQVSLISHAQHDSSRALGWLKAQIAEAAAERAARSGTGAAQSAAGA
ncbi:LysR family transcriptional regulator [Aquabacterium humicola]|uniref:LysR family transcriptional regulator n=1 Tax=Aquabacterium humicola TaxID=3237377 RepID=UPI002542EAEA|nr:LysR family transcriptional regulator [Rubrivivax pictus]